MDKIVLAWFDPLMVEVFNYGMYCDHGLKGKTWGANVDLELFTCLLHCDHGLEGIVWEIEVLSWHCMNESSMKIMWSCYECKCVTIERLFLNLTLMNVDDRIWRILQCKVYLELVGLMHHFLV